MAAKRLMALDVLRGLTIALMILVNTPGSWTYVYAPFRHAPWDGATPTDLVFPFFLFIVGVSMWFSFKKYGTGLSKEGLLKILKRFIIIFIIGLFLNGFPFFDVEKFRISGVFGLRDFEYLRIYGVLQRIAIAYAIAAILCLAFDYKKLIIAVVLILFGYWGIVYFGGSENVYSLESNVVGKLDRFMVGENHLYKGFGIPFDPEGFLSSIPAVGTVLIGYLTGRIIETSGDTMKAIKKLIKYGAIGVVLGLLWNNIYPFNKPLWSSSYVIYAGGLAMLFLSLLLWLIDVKGFRKWSRPFIHFGTNPLFIFVLAGLIARLFLILKITNSSGELISIKGYLFNDVFAPLAGNMNGSLLFGISHIIVFWLITYVLYRRKIFIKI